VLQTCFFAISGVLEREQAIEAIKASIQKTYGKRGAEVVKRNIEAVDRSLAALHQVPVPEPASSRREAPELVPADAPEFVRTVTAAMMAGHGDQLPVSALPVDGTYPEWHDQVREAQHLRLRRGLGFRALHPVRELQLRLPAQRDPLPLLRPGPPGRRSRGLPVGAAGRGRPPGRPVHAAGVRRGLHRVRVVRRGLSGVRGQRAGPQGDQPRRHEPLLASERENIAFFEQLPANDRTRVDFGTVRGTQFLDPLFEFSGACAGCGETPYLKLLSQLFGDRLTVANATGCSSIYGGNQPTTPWTVNADGHGPAWSNSLFEDNAEFGLGLRLAADRHTELARRRLQELRDLVGPELVDEILSAPQVRESELRAQRQRIAALERRLDELDGPAVVDLRSVLDHLIRRSVWIVGGDGWAYDIGSGGLDHVLASAKNVNVLVMDTEVYSNTGGQMSKATPLGAVAKFAAAGKTVPTKDLALQAIAYADVYVARVAFGADPQQTLPRLP
jgi:pyruvate-ferredoxin/flavodoxin oxidoreductase